MAKPPITAIEEYFGDITDPRKGNAIRHRLIDIITIAICGVICGADNWVDIENYGKAKEEWLREFLELPHGIPSHDTFGRVFARLDPEAFEESFLRWVQAVMSVTKGQVIAVDGKKLRRSHDRTLGKEAITMVSAWATANHLVLAQQKVDDDTNEIPTIPELLKVLDLSECTVTIDAIGCQTTIAEQIIHQQADYVLSLKKNQGTLYEDVVEIFTYAQETQFKGMTWDTHRTVNKGHGRIEVRECWTISDLDSFDFIRNLDAWQGIQTIVMVVSTRRLGDEVETDVRYFISSLPNNAAQTLHAVRSHWGIENSLHWILDIAFREDDSRIRKGNAPQNFAILRHIALNLLKQEKTATCGVKAKRLKAAWDEAYLLKVLLG